MIENLSDRVIDMDTIEITASDDDDDGGDGSCNENSIIKIIRGDAKKNQSDQSSKRKANQPWMSKQTKQSKHSILFLPLIRINRFPAIEQHFDLNMYLQLIEIHVSHC